jgi:cell wall-associated NlpC family hydrolase
MYGWLALTCLLAGNPCNLAEVAPWGGEPTSPIAAGPEAVAVAGEPPIVEVALGYLGRPYRFGGRDPMTGVDCASFVRLLFLPLGIELPFTAAAQMEHGEPVAEEQLVAGDVLFFRDTYKRGISHVGLYLGAGRFVHAAGRRYGVVVSSLARPYYRRRFAGARRLLRPPTVTPRVEEDPRQDAPVAGAS